MFISFEDYPTTLFKGDIISLDPEREFVRLTRNEKSIYFNQSKSKKRYRVSSTHISRPTFEGFIELIASTHGFKAEEVTPPGDDLFAYRFVSRTKA